MSRAEQRALAGQAMGLHEQLRLMGQALEGARRQGDAGREELDGVRQALAVERELNASHLVRRSCRRRVAFALA